MEPNSKRAIVPYLSTKMIEGQVEVIEEIKLPRQKQPTLQAMIDRWLGECTSPETRKAYTRIMKEFRAWLPAWEHEHGRMQWFPSEDDGSAVWDHTLKAFKEFLPTSRVGRTVSISTENQRLAALRAFYKSLANHRDYKENPLVLLKAKKNPYPHAALPLPDERIKISMQAMRTNTLADMRDKALLALLLATARRVSEVRKLQFSQIAYLDGHMRIAFIEKGGDVNHTTIDQATRGLVERYLAALKTDMQRRGREFKSETFLFVGLGNRSYGKPLSIQSVSKLCGIQFGETRVHALRHSIAVKLAKKGMAVNDIRILLGHATLAHTIKYLEEKQALINPYAEDVAQEFGIE